MAHTSSEGDDMTDSSPKHSGGIYATVPASTLSFANAVQQPLIPKSITLT